MRPRKSPRKNLLPSGQTAFRISPHVRDGDHARSILAALGCPARPETATAGIIPFDRRSIPPRSLRGAIGAPGVSAPQPRTPAGPILFSGRMVARRSENLMSASSKWRAGVVERQQSAAKPHARPAPRPHPRPRGLMGVGRWHDLVTPFASQRFLGIGRVWSRSRQSSPKGPKGKSGQWSTREVKSKARRQRRGNRVGHPGRIYRCRCHFSQKFSHHQAIDTVDVTL